jgi:hypothetical protein
MGASGLPKTKDGYLLPKEGKLPPGFKFKVKRDCQPVIWYEIEKVK